MSSKILLGNFVISISGIFVFSDGIMATLFYLIIAVLISSRVYTCSVPTTGGISVISASEVGSIIKGPQCVRYFVFERVGLYSIQYCLQKIRIEILVFNFFKRQALVN